MAAKRREDSSLLNESLEILLKTLDDIERRNVHLQKLCCARRSLFKPWPRKRNGDTEIPVEKEGAGVQTTGQSEDHLSASEKSEIAMMDKMLTKAQTAREVQQRIKESGRTRKTKHTDKKGDDSTKGTLKVSNQESVQNDNTSTQPSVTTMAKKTTNDRIIHNREKGTNMKNIKSQGDQTAPKSSTTHQGQSQRGKFSGRGSSSSASMRGSKKVVAAHLTAPFQTNPRLSVPKRQVDKRISSGAKCRNVIPAQKKSTIPSQRSGSNQKQTGKDNHKLENQRVRKDQETTEKFDTLVDDDSCEDKMSSAHNSSVDSNQSKEQEEETHLTEKPLVEESALVQNLTNPKVKDDTDTQEKEKRFCLLTDGKKLNIPGKLRRLYANNVRLREKVILQRMTKKVDVCTSRQEFVSKVESTFEWNEAQSVGRKVNAITNIYTNLLRLLCDLDLRDVDSWPSYDVLRAKRMVEFILTVFYKTEEERLKFNPDIFSSISCEGRQHQVEITPPQPSVTSQFWSSAFVKLDPCVFKALSKPHECLQYKSSRDLDRYTSLVFQIQYEQLQQRVLDTIATKVLPLLQCGNFKPSETVWMFRSLYSMLTANKSFPVIVKDTIQELEESPEDT